MKKTNERLKKVNGQISGLIKMIDKGEGCEKLIIQFQAAKAALDSAFSETLNTNLKKCLKKKDSKNIETILKLITKK
jgi:DNA-binding FrmR family transcriptional regulator